MTIDIQMPAIAPTIPSSRSYPATTGYPANKERAKLAHFYLNWIPTFVGMSGFVGVQHGH